MKFFPFEKFTLSSDLPAEEIRRRLALNVQKRKLFSISPIFKKPHKAYEGTLNHSSFEVNRVISHRNSFLPIVTGKILEKGNVTEVKLVMRLHLVVYIIWFSWIGILGGALVYTCYDYFFGVVSPDESHLLGIVIMSAMLSIGYIGGIVGFEIERKRSKKFFTKLVTLAPGNAPLQ